MATSASRTSQEVFKHHAQMMIGGDLEKTATAAGSRGENGVETFLVRDGEIVLQTVHHTLQTT